MIDYMMRVRSRLQLKEVLYEEMQETDQAYIHYNGCEFGDCRFTLYSGTTRIGGAGSHRIN
jgi:hypothetical protein